MCTNNNLVHISTNGKKVWDIGEELKFIYNSNKQISSIEAADDDSYKLKPCFLCFHFCFVGWEVRLKLL